MPNLTVKLFRCIILSAKYKTVRNHPVYKQNYGGGWAQCAYFFVMRKNTRFMTHSALIAALYVALSHLQNVLLPGSGSQMIQFRVSEALCVLSLFTPAAIPGLAVGCLLFNLSTAGALPLDFIVGTAASALAAAGMYLTRSITVKGYPVLAMLMPAVFNSLLVGWELAHYVGGGFWLNALCVGIGEVGVLFTLGTALFYSLQGHRDIFR